MDDARQELAPVAESAPAPNEGASILSLIERAARDPSVDLDRMERLYVMHERMVDRERETAFNAAMTAAQAEIPRVYRDAENSHTRSRYARLETISKAITPIITKHGFGLSFGTDASPLEGHYRITCEVTHAAGFKRTAFADLPSDTVGAKGAANKTAIQGFGSAMSYGRRYLTLLIFNVALTNEDDDGQSAGDGGGLTREQEVELSGLIRDTRTNTAKFLAIFGVESLPDIPASRFGHALQILRDRQRQQAGASQERGQ